MMGPASALQELQANPRKIPPGLIELAYITEQGKSRPDITAQVRHQTIELPRAFRTVHPLGWAIWKGENFAPTEEELLAGIQG